MYILLLTTMDEIIFVLKMNYMYLNPYNCNKIDISRNMQYKENM